MTKLLCVVRLLLLSKCMHSVPAPTLPVTTLASTCTYTIDAQQNVVLDPTCTSQDIFVNAGAADFRLVPNSPAIGRALCIPNISPDFAGNPRPTAGRPPGQGCDIGAYQFVGALIVPIPQNVRITGVQP